MLERLMQIPALGKFTLERLKANAFNSFQIPLTTALENQTKALNQKLERMEKTDIGKKLEIHKRINIKKIPEQPTIFTLLSTRTLQRTLSCIPLKNTQKLKQAELQEKANGS